MAGFYTFPLQLITLLLVLSSEGRGKPTTQCPTLETLRLMPGSRLELQCKSLCGGTEHAKFEWLRSNGAEGKTVSTIQSEDMALVVESVGYQDGGTYKCRCLPDGPLCEQFVYIIPTMNFIASDKYIYSGDAVEFSCTVSMTEPQFPTVGLVLGKSLDGSSHEKEESSIDSHTVETAMWIYKQENLRQDYFCEVDSYIGGKFMEKLHKNLTIYSYVPPEVAFTTEFKLEGKEDFGKPGKVSCSILTSPDTGSMVNWLFKGEPVPLDQQEKYRAQTINRNDDLIEHVLFIEDVQAADMGPYVCRLTSDFHLESENEVWISFREKSKHQDEKDIGRTSAYVYVIISVVGVVICALGVWLKYKRNSDHARKLL